MIYTARRITQYFIKIMKSNKITILIISYRSLEKLKSCIKTIGSNKEIIVIENSDNQQLKKSIESEHQNCKVVLNNSNLGYAKASNIGFKLIKTEYALLLNTDIIIYENQIEEMEKEVGNLKGNFSLASPLSDDLIDFNKNNKLDNFFDNKIPNFNIENSVTKVDLIKGCSLLVNLKKFKNENIFDDNFFFFFEEIDLCRKIKEKNESIYVFNQIKIQHKSAQSIDEKFNTSYHNFRHWNFFWGRYYYFKKHYGFFFALIYFVPIIIRINYRIILYKLKNDKINYDKYKTRRSGLYASILNQKSSKRI